ncbi:MAG: hypothetical protein GY753_09895 [Gammaproteobacteria bacterium]|nr:hypothetical protein [Gammaproteobacteria bacterium]
MTQSKFSKALEEVVDFPISELPEELFEMGKEGWDDACKAIKLLKPILNNLDPNWAGRRFRQRQKDSQQQKDSQP